MAINMECRRPKDTLHMVTRNTTNPQLPNTRRPKANKLRRWRHQPKFLRYLQLKQSLHSLCQPLWDIHLNLNRSCLHPNSIHHQCLLLQLRHIPV